MNNEYNEEIDEIPMLEHSNFRKAIIPSLFSITAFSLLYYGTTVPCIYVNSHVSYNSGLDDYLGIGFYSYELNGECYSTASDYKPDHYLEAGRVCIVLALLFGGIGTLSICLILCYDVTFFEMKLSAFLLFSASLSSGLSLLILNSNLCNNDVVVVGQVLSSDCELNVGSRCAISAMVLWFFASISNVCTVVHDTDSVASRDDDHYEDSVEQYRYLRNDDENQMNALFNAENTITVPLL